MQQAPSISKPKTNEAEKLAAEVQEANTIWKRKYVVRAVGVAVLVVAFTFVGARLKEMKQERDRLEGIEAAARELAAGAQNTGIPVSQIVSVADAQLERSGEQTNIQGVSTPAAVDQTRNSPYSIDIARQIALLEDRKTTLNRQKMSFEAKIQMLRERQARRAERDARRLQGNG